MGTDFTEKIKERVGADTVTAIQEAIARRPTDERLCWSKVQKETQCSKEDLEVVVTAIFLDGDLNFKVTPADPETYEPVGPTCDTVIDAQSAELEEGYTAQNVTYLMHYYNKG